VAQEYAVCNTGLRQSPIDLANAAPAAAPPFTLRYRPSPVALETDGRLLRALVGGENMLLTDKRAYRLTDLRFHHPSEHLLAGKRFPLEIQFTHRSAEGFIAMLAVLVHAGQGNAALGALWPRFPVPEEHLAIKGLVDLTALLPRARLAFRYSGSQSVPPCSEMVDWTVFQQRIEASVTQLEDFAAAYPANARPVQERKGRPIFLDLF
jgi:carbonic anhydrase